MQRSVVVIDGSASADAGLWSDAVAIDQLRLPERPLTMAALSGEVVVLRWSCV